MTDIFIKSFNRAFYLERCIQSIINMIKGDYRITVLDDGTPEKYLSKIKQRYPQVQILKSENYERKQQAIIENLSSGKEINGFEIPTELWINAAKNASDYFIMTEDDVWFTTPINVDELNNQCREHEISLLKLGWLGNNKRDGELSLSAIGNEQLLSTKPKKLFLSNPLIMDWFIYNKFKLFTILYKLGFVNNYTKQKYWHLNSILMGFWKKDYWLFVWKDAKGVVDEKQQLRNAAVYYRNHKQNSNFIARTKTEVMKTTFKSSSTNSYHKYGDDFDVNYFNHLINEAWLEGKFNAMQNFPNDFSTHYLEEFLDEKINKTAFRQWIENFKNQYKKLGCDVE